MAESVPMDGPLASETESNMPGVTTTHTTKRLPDGSEKFIATNPNVNAGHQGLHVNENTFAATEG